MNDKTLQELASLFFSTKQIIRAKLPEGKVDPNAWLRFQTMRYIEDSKGPTMHELAAYLRIKAPSATSLVAHLALRGFVRRIAGKDKRVTRLYLTPRGRKLLAKHDKHSNAIMRTVFSGFTDGEIRELVRLLRHLRGIHGPNIRS